jgi:hypothetical protein
MSGVNRTLFFYLFAETKKATLLSVDTLVDIVGVDIVGVDIVGVDIVGVDIIGVNINAPTLNLPPFCRLEEQGRNGNFL